MQALFANAPIVEAAGRREGNVLVEDGVIRDVEARPLQVEGRHMLDLAGRTLMPSLIDCHVHVVASMMNLAANARLPDVLAVLRSLPILRGMLAGATHEIPFRLCTKLGGYPTRSWSM